MKCFLIITIVFLTCVFFSCSGRKKKVEDEKCLPATVLIVYLGEDNKPTFPLVIRTDEKDTSYLTFMGSEKDKLEKNGFVISKEYFRISTMKPEIYHYMKSYIIAHNTHKEGTISNANENTMKILLIDKCDSLAYNIDKEEKGYFSKMIDTLNLKAEDDELRGYIKYYHEILEWDSSRLR